MLSPTPRAVILTALALAALTQTAATPATTAVWQRFQERAAQTMQTLEAAPSGSAIAEGLPRLELSFVTLFKPLGDRGLEYSAGVSELAGKLVQMTGYIVREADRAPGVFLLTSRPLRTDTSGGMADLPPAAVHVVLAPAWAEAPVGYRPGAITVVGVLELGAEPMRDGRNSILRLRLDADATRVVLGERVP